MDYFEKGRGNFWYSTKYRDLMNSLRHMDGMDKIEGADLYQGRACFSYGCSDWP